MNLNAIVSPLIAAVNPTVLGTVRASTGYTIGADHKQAPAYADTAGVPMQVQPLSGRDLKQLDGLNVSGADRAVYVNGQLHGVIQAKGLGGDLLNFDGSWWLVVAVLEPWDHAGWCKVAVVLQK